LKNELVPLFDQLAKKTRIPKSRLLDEAIEDLLVKHNIELPTEDTKD
jgi:predicted transcriptional regulator